MLREKKFNLIKHMGLNKLFDTSLDDKLNQHNINCDVDPNDYIVDLTIKEFDNYTLIKEQSLEAYLLCLNDIIVIHMSQDYIKDFEFLYKKSSDYVFDIYKTSSSDLKTEEIKNMYHIFCISKKLTVDMDLISYLQANDSDKTYTYISLFYGPCILVNKRFDMTSNSDKYNAKYKFIKTIGKGIINDNIRNLVKQAISIANTLQKTLPPHYLKIN